MVTEEGYDALRELITDIQTTVDPHLLDLDYTLLNQLLEIQLSTLAYAHLKKIASCIEALPRTQAEQLDMANDENYRVISTMQTIARTDQLYAAVENILTPFLSPILQEVADELLSHMLFVIAADMRDQSLTETQKRAYFLLMALGTKDPLIANYAILALENLENSFERSFVDMSHLSINPNTKVVPSIDSTELLKIKEIVSACIHTILAKSEAQTARGEATVLSQSALWSPRVWQSNSCNTKASTTDDKDAFDNSIS